MQASYRSLLAEDTTSMQVCSSDVAAVRSVTCLRVQATMLLARIKSPVVDRLQLIQGAEGC